MIQINVNEAKTNLSKLIEKVLAGEEVVIARSGKPVARLVPLARKAPRQPGLLSGRVEETFFDPLPAEEVDSWEGGA